MPTSPEVLNVKSFVRAIEIDRELDVKKKSNSKGHIGIPGEVKVELKGITETRSPCFNQIKRLCCVKPRIGPLGKRIGNDYFFKQIDGE